MPMRVLKCFCGRTPPFSGKRGGRMKKTVLSLALALVFLTACSAGAAAPPEESDQPRWDPMYSDLAVFPASARELVVPGDVYLHALLTDGSVVVIPGMRLDDLPESLRETLELTEGPTPFGTCFGLELVQPDFEDVLCTVYASADLRLITVCRRDTQYSDAGTEYLYSVQALSKTFCNHQGFRLGDSAEDCYISQDGDHFSGGYANMTFTVEDGMIVGMTAGVAAVMEFLKVQADDLKKWNE